MPLVLTSQYQTYPENRTSSSGIVPRYISADRPPRHPYPLSFQSLTSNIRCTNLKWHGISDMHV
jgi:hypothetical protein